MKPNSDVAVMMMMDLNRYCINVRRVFTSQYNSFKGCWESASPPLPTSCKWLRWWHYHQHIIVSLHNTNHTHCASFFYIPDNKTPTERFSINMLLNKYFRTRLLKKMIVCLHFFEPHYSIIT